MVRKFLTSAALTLALATPALASSGSYVVSNTGNGPGFPNCVQFTMFDDGNTVTYGVSVQDPDYAGTVLKLALSKLMRSPLFFLTGTPAAPVGPGTLHPADCASSSIVYAFRIDQ
jgi:hypothetical protein